MKSVEVFAERVLTRLPQPVWVVDDEGLIGFANEAAAAQVGFSSTRALVGRPSHDTVHHHHPDGREYPAEQCPVLGNAVNDDPADQWFIRPDGTSFPIKWTATALDLGDRQATILTFTDVSDHRKHTQVANQQRWNDIHRQSPRAPEAETAEDLLQTVMSYIDLHASDHELSPRRLAAHHHMSLRSLQMLFTGANSSPASYIRRRRLDFAHGMLLQGHPVAHTAQRSGFSGSTTFARAFQRQFGHPPSAVLRRTIT